MDAAFQSSLYSAAVALCVFAAGLLRDPRTRVARAPDFFTLFLILEALGFTLELLMVHPASPLKGLWLAFRMGTSLLVAPCLWLAVKEAVDGTRPRWSSLSRGHLYPIVAGCLLLLPLAEAAHLGTTYANPLRATSALHARVIHGTMLGCVAIFGVQVPVYLWRCRRLLLDNFHRRHPDASGPNAGALAWLHLPLVAVLTTWALGLLRTVQCAAHAPRELSMLFALTDVSVTAGGLYLIVRRVSRAVAEPLPPPPPQPLTMPIAAPEPPECAVVIAPPGEAPSARSASPEAHYAKSPLPAVVRARIRRKIEAALGPDALHRDSQLNLRTLSTAIKENARYVSQVINQDLATTFYELVNRRRVEHARRLLLDAPERTILEIALAVGFNSKSTFNAAFLRLTGRTPSAFRADPPR